MREYKFNYCIPDTYKDFNTQEVKYTLASGGRQLPIATLEEIQNFADINKPKDGQPWGQIFSNGFRVTTENRNFGEWNGFTFSDIDSKWFYDYEEHFNVEKLLDAIHSQGELIFSSNYFASQITPSNKSYRIFWYWDCERNEQNFRKCCLLSEMYTRNLFYSLGEKGKRIIDYNKNGHCVLDHCSRSVLQGFYVCSNKINYSTLRFEECFGNVILNDIELDGIYSASACKTIGDFNQSEQVKFKGKNNVNIDRIKYYPHAHRRCIYEALVVLFNEKEKIDAEWEYICNLLPTSDGTNTGHTTQFFINEPHKNRWYELTSHDIVHPLNWLKPFGYAYEDNTEYIYGEHFYKSWKKHINRCIFNLYIDEKIRACDKWDTMKESERTSAKQKWYDEIPEVNIFDTWFDKNITSDNNNKKLLKYRREYYKIKFEKQDFKYLCNGYEIAKDLTTYKMYADFYYRDENNVPTIKYSVLEDDIKVYGYNAESDKICYHTFKYNDEYTHWKNGDTFDNKCVKTDMLCAVNKYATRWHGYHEIKDYFNSLDLSIADNEMLETWAMRYFDCEDTKYHREVCKKWLVGAVKKIMVENAQEFVFPHILFLQGATGCGKTFFLSTMFSINGHSYILNKIDPNGADCEIAPLISKNWLIQFGESENLKKVSVNAQKEFVDRMNMGMKYQKKYENEQTTIYPRIVACRTSNDDTLFNDISISNGDRRNWLIVCKTGINACDEAMRERIEMEKDILWATAYKLYLDDPNQNLELTFESFNELANIQEEYKLIKNDDLKEIYDEIFERTYLTNGRFEIMDETHFIEMVKRSDVMLQRKSTYVEALIDDNDFVQHFKITRIPAKWINTYVSKEYSNSHMKLLKKYLLENGWEYKACVYLGKTTKCYSKISA